MAGPIKRRHAGTTVSSTTNFADGIQLYGETYAAVFPIPESANLWYADGFTDRYNINGIPFGLKVHFDVLASNYVVTDIFFVPVQSKK